MTTGLVTLEHVQQDPAVLVVTSGWPRPEAPMHCVFIKRQMDSLAELGIRYEALMIHGYRSPSAYLVAGARLAAMNFRRQRYRLVHAHGGEAALAACLYRRAPLVISYLGGDLLGNSYRRDAEIGLRGRLRRWVLRQTARFAVRTITKSGEMENTLPRGARHRNRVVPNGVDTRLFHPVDQSVARRVLGWANNERVALFVGDPKELRKRFGLAGEAVKRASNTVTGLRLVVVHGVEPHLVPTYMNAADCLLLLSWMEGSPNVVKEALMCNLPVIATPVGDILELLHGVEPSFVVEPTAERVAQALVGCLNSPRRSNGREQSHRLTAEAIAEKVISLYKSTGVQLSGIGFDPHHEELG